MGSFKGHVLPGTLFLLVGLWRVWSAAARHAASPSTFRVRAWNPVGVPGPSSSSSSPLRLLELYVIAGGAFVDMCVEVLYSTHLKIFVDGGEINPAHLNDLEHGGMLLMFFLFGALALASQLWPRICWIHDEHEEHDEPWMVLYSTHLKIFVDGGEINPAHLNDLEHGGMLLMFFLFGALALASQLWPRYFPLTDGALCLIAATAFTAEFVLFYFHSTTHMGLEGYYHYLLVVLVGLCIAATVLSAMLPASFPVDLASGVLIALQGLWFYQTAFTLYGPMLPAGCARDADGHIDCHARAAQERAEQLANFQFFGLVFLVFCYVIACYAVAAARCGHPEELAATAMHDKHVAAMEFVGGDGGGDRVREECAI